MLNNKKSLQLNQIGEKHSEAMQTELKKKQTPTL